MIEKKTSETCSEDCQECQGNCEARIPPVMVLSSENRGILNAAGFVLELYQREKTERFEKRLKEMIGLLPEMVSHYKKKEELFLPYYWERGFEEEVEKEFVSDKEILEGIKTLQLLLKDKSPYEFETEYLSFCKKAVLIAKNENTELLVSIYHNLTQEQMDEIGRRIPDYGYTFLAVKPKPEDLVSTKGKMEKQE